VYSFHIYQSVLQCEVGQCSLKLISSDKWSETRSSELSYLFCIYIDKLIKQLQYSSIGCQISNVYLGVWVYADDIILLSPSRRGLQDMVNICEQFANIYKLKFSTNVNVEKSKTKCLIFSKRVININDIDPIILNRMPLPFVTNVKHIGNL